MTTLWLQPLGQSLSALGLALIIGGILALGAFTAPVLFQHFERAEAGSAMTVIFRRYDVVMTVALLLVLVGEGLQTLMVSGLSVIAAVQPAQWLMNARLLALVLMAVLMGINLFHYNPQLEAAQKQGVALLPANDPAVVAFNLTHVVSEKLYKGAFVMAMLLLLSMPWLMVTSMATVMPADSTGISP